MFRFTAYSFVPLSRTRKLTAVRYLHRATGDFVNYDPKGSLSSTKVRILLGDPGETFVLIYPEIGHALHAGSLIHTCSTSATRAEDRCKLTFFHDSPHFGFGK